VANPTPVPVELVLAVQALERVEDPLGVGPVEADAVVPDVVGGPSFPLDLAELYERLGLLGGELPGVFEQVLQHHP
jgi:hypothetical protein